MAVLIRLMAILVIPIFPTFVMASPDIKQSLDRYFRGSAIQFGYGHPAIHGLN